MHEIVNDICTIIGSLVGVGGLVVSILALKKAKSVQNTLKMYTNELSITQTDNSNSSVTDKSSANNKLKGVTINGSYTGRDNK